MEKISGINKKRIGNLLSLGKLAKKELASALTHHQQERLHLLQSQINEYRKASRKTDEDLSRKIASFMFKHSKKINAALISSPKFLPRFVGQHFGDGFEDPFGDRHGNPLDNPRWKEFVTMAKVMEQYFNIELQPFDRFALVRPIIFSCPTTLNVGDTYTYTITGQRFGASPGSIYITITATSIRIDPVVLQWSDTAIMFNLPSSVGNVQFHAEGWLTVENADGYPSSVRVIVEPLTHLYTYVDSRTDQGQKNISHTPVPDWSYTYEKEITFTSPSVPQEYTLFNNQNLPTTGLNLVLYTYSYLTPEGIEDAAKVELLDGPYESGNCLNARVKVIDDWYWDYCVGVCFFIIVPNGYSTQGWTREGS